MAGPPLGSPSEPLFAQGLQRMEQASKAALRPLEMAWGLGYAALAGGLLALVHFMSHVPGANIAAQILS